MSNYNVRNNKYRHYKNHIFMNIMSFDNFDKFFNIMLQMHIYYCKNK